MQSITQYQIHHYYQQFMTGKNVFPLLQYKDVHTSPITKRQQSHSICWRKNNLRKLSRTQYTNHFWCSINSIALYNNNRVLTLIFCWQFSLLEPKNLVIGEELEAQLHEYYMICSDHIFGQECGSKLLLCHCSHYIVSKPAMESFGKKMLRYIDIYMCNWYAQEDSVSFQHIL